MKAITDYSEEEREKAVQSILKREKELQERRRLHYVELKEDKEWMFDDVDGVVLELLSHLYWQGVDDTNCNRIAACIRAAAHWYHPNALMTDIGGYYSMLAKAGFLTDVEANAWEAWHRREREKITCLPEMYAPCPDAPNYLTHKPNWEGMNMLYERREKFEWETLRHAYRFKYPAITGIEIDSMQERNLKGRPYQKFYKRMAKEAEEAKKKRKKVSML